MEIADIVSLKNTLGSEWEIVKMTEEERQALVITADENYAHARDHEHLRAQVTSILVAASFVLVGLALDNLTAEKLIYMSCILILLGILNILLVFTHTNRFKMHVDVARQAKSRLAEVSITSGVSKKFSLTALWYVLASTPVVSGLGLLAMYIIQKFYA